MVSAELKAAGSLQAIRCLESMCCANVGGQFNNGTCQLDPPEIGQGEEVVVLLQDDGIVGPHGAYATLQPG